MKNLNLVIQREYTTRVRKKSFIILTLLMPFLMVGFIFVPVLLAGINKSSEQNIAIIDYTGIYAPEFKSTSLYHFEIIEEGGGDEAHGRLGKDLYAILQITDNLKENPGRASILSEKQVSVDLLSMIEDVLVDKVIYQRLEELSHADDVNQETIGKVRTALESKTNISLKTMRMSSDGEAEESSAVVATIVGLVFTMLVYMFILMYGSMVMQSVLEEKKSRIIEVMISSVKPVTMLIGKIIGVGLVGITQLFIWTALGSGLFALMSLFVATPDTTADMMAAGSASVDASMVNEVMAAVGGINWFEIIFYFVLFFIGGYVLYASLFAMFASAVDSEEDTQQFMLPVTLIIIFAFLVGTQSATNPDGPLAFWASLIPFTSPIVMMVRIPFGVPWWEKILSLGLLYGTFVFISYFAAKVYRVGILMYGKKPSIKEMIKWMRYK